MPYVMRFVPAPKAKMKIHHKSLGYVLAVSDGGKVCEEHSSRMDTSINCVQGLRLVSGRRGSFACCNGD